MFASIGLGNTALDFAMFTALIALTPIAPLVANVFSFSLGAVNSFVLNSRITFRDRPMSLWAPQRVWRFAAVTLCALALSSAVLALLLTVLPPLPAKAGSVVVVFAASYLMNATLVFRPAQSPNN